MIKPYFPIIAVCLLVIAAAATLPAKAQKLKDVQEISAAAPPQIRVDGKNKEWNDGFLAHNKRTNIFYTLCNDDKNLYLVIKSDNVENNAKILAGGITFSVNADGKKKQKESINLTYPLISRTDRRGQGGGGGRRGMGRGGDRNAAQTAAERDSIAAATQQIQLAQVKEIKVTGFKDITDTLISIYNEYGIKASASIDKDRLFFYEMAIPLGKLGISPGSEFAYNIKVNGLEISNFGGGGGGGGFGGGVRGGRSGGGGNIDFQSLTSPTDFWGKYTLTKK